MVSWAHALCSSSAALLRCVLGPRAKLDRVLRGVGQHPAGLISDAARVGRVLAQTLAKLGPSEAKRFLLAQMNTSLVRPVMKIGCVWTDK